MRSELIHPMLVHYPIALIGLALITYCGTFLFRQAWFETTFRVCLYGALVLVGAALFTGDFAEDIVKRSLCNIRILSEHDEHAHQTLYVLLAALVIDSAIYLSRLKKPNFQIILRIVLLLLLLAANASLVITGHYGSKLVYEQGAAVQGAKLDCS